MIKRIIICFFIFISGCNKCRNHYGTYNNNGNIVNKNGIPINKDIPYYPAKIPLKNTFYQSELDSFQIKIVSKLLYSFKEPVLFNDNQNNDIFRLLWTRAFHRPVLIKMTKDGSDVTLTTKILNRYPELIPQTKIIFYPPIYKKSKSGKTYPVFRTKEEPVPPDTAKIFLIVNETKRLSLDEWNSFIQKIDKIDFFNMRPYIKENLGLDGSDWLLEASMNDSYWYVMRWSPRNSFQECCEHLIQLSKAKNERRY